MLLLSTDNLHLCEDIGHFTAIFETDPRAPCW